jgi:hypothetical protein
MNRNFSLILLLACLIGFALGIVELFKLRFETGDVYPEYSSLRNDPLGASAFYESLGRLPGMSADRDFSVNGELPAGSGIAYLHLAGDSGDWKALTEETFKEIESFLRHGGRLVVALFPKTTELFKSSSRERKPEVKKTASQPAEKSGPGKPGRKREKTKGATGERWVSLKERWGLEFGFKKLAPGPGGSYEPVFAANNDEPSLPDFVTWHSGLVFTNLDPAWRVIYSRDSSPVLIERKFGAGSVVFSTDTYFISNEALRKERHAELLAWLIGSCRRAVFDEAHLGIVEAPGVASLMRRYHLHGLVAGLLLLAGLFIWKNLAGFAPPGPEEKADAYVAGKDSAAGFVNLLRRHVAPRELLNVCVAEWGKSFPRQMVSPARRERVQAVINAEKARPPRERDSVRAYLAICEALKKGAGVTVSVPASNSAPSAAENKAP